MGMRLKLQKEREVDFGFRRWWDADWRDMLTETLKNPEVRFDAQTLEMAKLIQ